MTKPALKAGQKWKTRGGEVTTLSEKMKGASA